MEVEKRSSKGGFFHLFDWNIKSRKKLFSNKSELSESSKHGRDHIDSSATSRIQRVREYGPGPTARGNYDLYCSSSVCGDEEYGTRAPGVVARLMGLNSLPTSNVSQTFVTPYFESHSFRGSQYLRGADNVQNEHHAIVYENMRYKLDGPSHNPMELRLQKVQNRPIEKFQTEVLPPKSAKPISITHNRLLSPIKSPGFIPTKNAAYIIEAAAKIIEQSPRSTTNGKLQSFGSPSVPLSMRNLKEKIEAAQRSTRIPEASPKAKEQNSLKQTKRQPANRIQNQSGNSQHSSASMLSQRIGSQSLKAKEKPVSLAAQAKVNIQRREGSPAPVDNRSLSSQKLPNEVKTTHVGRNQPYRQKNAEKRSSTSKSSDVLRQNNQKQNCGSTMDGPSLNPSASHPKERKTANSISRPSKTVNKIFVSTAGSYKKTDPAPERGKEISSSQSKTSSQKKHSMHENICSDGTAHNVAMRKDEKTVKHNVTVEGCNNPDLVDRKNGMDVVSFTFTSPIKKALPRSNSSGKVMDKRNSQFLVSDFPDDNSESKTSDGSSSGFNATSGDALSVLLERKLKELTSQSELSHQNVAETGLPFGSANSSQDSEPSFKRINVSPVEYDQRFQLDACKNKVETKYDIDYSLKNELRLKVKQTCQGPDEVGEHCNVCNTDYGRESELQCSSLLSSMEEPSFSGGSSYSLDSYRSFISNGGKPLLPVEADELMEWSSTRNPQPVEGNFELADSASSASAGAVCTDPMSNLEVSSSWEQLYIREILGSADTTVVEFALGDARDIVNPNLFDQLENRIKELSKTTEEHKKLGRNLLFDFVGEYLESSSLHSFCGSFRAWDKWTVLFKRKERLAEELYRQISGWTCQEDSKVDELVDKDMSSMYGKWVGFEIEEFEEGVAVEKAILTSLIDELVDEFSYF